MCVMMILAFWVSCGIHEFSGERGSFGLMGSSVKVLIWGPWSPRPSVDLKVRQRIELRNMESHNVLTPRSTTNDPHRDSSSSWQTTEDSTAYS
jgi:hypothetical protein